MIKKSKVCAVVVTYNRLDCLKKCIEHILAQMYICDLLIVDNGSTDGTGEWCAEHTAFSANYLNTGANLGGAGGFNRGIRWAAEAGWESLWLMDDDCWPEPDALEKLVETSIDLEGKYGWLSSKCLWTDGSLCKMNVQRVTPFRDMPNTDEPICRNEMASFVSLFIPSAVVAQFGLPIEDFYIWGDDWEYTRRISRKMPCYFAGNSRVVHAMKNNTVVSIAEDSDERLPRYRYSYRNDVYLYRREGVKGWLWLISKDIWHSIRAIRAGHAGRIKIIWQGFLKGLFFKPAIEFVSGKDNTNID